MAYQMGDSPAEPMRVSVYSVDLSEYSFAAAFFEAVGTTYILRAEIVGDEVLVYFEDHETRDPVPLLPGVQTLLLTVVDPEKGKQRFLPAIRFIVESNHDDGWHTVSSAQDSDWPDAREMNEMTLLELLETSKRDVLAFAPELEPGQAVPTSYKMAQLLHARNRWNAALADPSTGDIGGEGFAIPARPLDWQIKQLLRPSTGIPAGF